MLLVAAEIVQNHDVARTKLGNENVDNILVEDFAVGGGVDGHAGCPAVAEERPDDGPYAPVAVWSGVADALAAQGPAVKTYQFGRCGGFVDEHEVCRNPFHAFFEPALPLCPDFRTVLFGGPERFFL